MKKWWIQMIHKTSDTLLNWIYKHVIKFTDENDISGLTWRSSQDDALKFLHSIPPKERVQKYNFYSTHSHFFRTDRFEDIEEALKKGFISEATCSRIYKWNSDAGYKTWDMDDVETALHPETRLEKELYVSNIFYKMIVLGLIECVNPEDDGEKLYRLTEKGNDIMGERNINR